MFKPVGWWDRFFVVAIIAKGLDGVIEVVGALALLLVSPGQIRDWAVLATRAELSEDPHDVIATYIRHAAAGFTSHTLWFVVLYLLAHGLVKVVLVAAIWLDKLWAYPWMIGVLIAFIGYQLYRIALSPSAGLVALTVFDAIIVVLTWHEYRHRRHRRHHQPHDPADHPGASVGR